MTNELVEVTLTDSQLTFRKPVSTPFGIMRFLTWDEYSDLQNDLSWIAQNVLHLYYIFLKTIPEHEKELRKEFRAFKEYPLKDIVLTYDMVRLAYERVLIYMLDQNEYADNVEVFADVIRDICSNDESFMLMRAYIMKMNLLKEDKVSPNAKLQQLFERDREVQSRVNGDVMPTLSDIAFTVATHTPHTIDEVQLMSPIQVHNFYARINANKDYERNILFATVSNEVEIESWAKKIDLFEVKDTSISKSSFDQRNAGMFKQ